MERREHASRIKMIFNSQLYFYGVPKEDLLEIPAYNSAFEKGILICPDLLYYFVIGSYSENQSTFQREGIRKFALNNEESLNYKALSKLLDKVMFYIKKRPLLIITPHTFTKFMHKLWGRTDDNQHRQVINLFKEEFGYVREEEIKKEDILDFENFKYKILGISETALLLLKNKKDVPCIISSNSKILKEYKEDFLYVNFNDLLSFVRDEERKNQLI